MNPTKKSILTGEALLKQKQGFLDRIHKLLFTQTTMQYDPCAAILLEMKNLELQEQVDTITTRLEKLRKQYLVEFEAESKEANEKMGSLIMIGKSLAGKEPIAISTKIQELIAELTPRPEQEHFNDVFYELQSHINFFKKKVK